MIQTIAIGTTSATGARLASIPADLELAAPVVGVPAKPGIGLLGLDGRRWNRREAGTFEPLDEPTLLVGGEHDLYAFGTARARSYVTDDLPDGLHPGCGIAEQDDASCSRLLDNRLPRTGLIPLELTPTISSWPTCSDRLILVTTCAHSVDR